MKKLSWRTFLIQKFNFVKKIFLKLKIISNGLIFLFFSLSHFHIAKNVIISDSDTTQASWQNTNYGLPYFDNTTKRDHIATVGSAAKLQCVVRNLGDRAVSMTSRNFFNILLKFYGALNIKDMTLIKEENAISIITPFR